MCVLFLFSSFFLSFFLSLSLLLLSLLSNLQNMHALLVHNLHDEVRLRDEEPRVQLVDAALGQLHRLFLVHPFPPVPVEDGQDEVGGVSVGAEVHLLQRGQVVAEVQRSPRTFVEAAQQHVRLEGRSAEGRGECGADVVGRCVGGEGQVVLQGVEVHVLLDVLPELLHVGGRAGRGEQFMVVQDFDLRKDREDRRKRAQEGDPMATGKDIKRNEQGTSPEDQGRGAKSEGLVCFEGKRNSTLQPPFCTGRRPTPLLKLAHTQEKTAYLILVVLKDENRSGGRSIRNQKNEAGEEGKKHQAKKEKRSKRKRSRNARNQTTQTHLP